MQADLSPELPLKRQSNEYPSEWWGAVGAPRTDLTLEHLVENGTLTQASCSLLGQSVAIGRSVLIASRESGAGKTTLLTALLSQLDPSRRRVFVRGSYETFSFLHGATPTEVALLVNEISPYLQMYCWGESLRRLLIAHRSGYQFLSTIHADSAKEVRSLLLPFSSTSIDSLPFADLTIAFISQKDDGERVHRFVQSIVTVSLSSEAGVGDDSLLRWQPDLAIPVSATGTALTVPSDTSRGS